MFQKCFLHIGLGKTGTTSIQTMLTAKRQELLNQNVYLADSGPSHIFLASAFAEHPENLSIHFRNNRVTADAIQAFNDHHTEALRTAAKKNPDKTLLLSCEHLSIFNLDEASSLAGFIAEIARQTTIVCYVRDPLDHVLSLHLEYVRNGRVELEAPLSDTYLSAKSVIEIFTRAFPDAEINVQAYNPADDVVAGFLKTIGVELEQVHSDTAPLENIRYSHEALLLVEFLNALAPPRLNSGWNADRSKTLNLTTIEGAKYQPTASQLTSINSSVDEDRKFLSRNFDIDFSDGQQFDPEFQPALWQDKTQRSVAKLLNKQSLEIEKLHALIAYKNGVIAKLDNDIEAAIEHLELALALRPSLIEALRRLSDIFLEQDKGQNAVDACKTFILRNQEDINFRLELARVYANLNEMDQARATVQEAMRLDPGNEECLKLEKSLAE